MEKQTIQKLLETKSGRLGFETYEGKSQVNTKINMLRGGAGAGSVATGAGRWRG